MTTLFKPKLLQQGDTVTTISLSWGGAGELLPRYETGKKQLQDTFGLKVVETKNALKSADYISKNPQARADDLMATTSISKSRFNWIDKMKELNKSFTLYRLFGVILLVCSLLGYIFVADELHHFGEFLGVTCILFAGLIFLVIDTKLNVFKGLAIQWISLGLLISIPIGGVVLDNMPLGITICFLIGLVLAYVFGKRVTNPKS